LTISKNISIPELQENEEKADTNYSKFKITRNPSKRPIKTFIRISFYDYGSEGIKWHYLRKLIKSR
jgi:hypothetical protein